MERFLGVEEARGALGRLVDEVAEGAEPIVLAKRGRAKAVLLSFDDYGRLKSQASRRAREELGDWLREVRKQVEEADLDPSVVDAAIAATREMRWSGPSHVAWRMAPDQEETYKGTVTHRPSDASPPPAPPASSPPRSDKRQPSGGFGGSRSPDDGDPDCR